MRSIKRTIALFLGITLFLSLFGCTQRLDDRALFDETLTEEKKAETEETKEEEVFREEALIQPGETGSFPLSLMSFNLRRPYDVDTGARSWQARREAIFRYLVSSGADVICLQEAPRAYYEDLKANLSDTFLFLRIFPILFL